MGKNSPRNPLWPDWFDGEKIDEVTFCHELIHNHPMKCIENRFFTPDGPVEDEAELKQLILKEIQAFIIHGLSKKVSNLLESLRIIAYSAPLDIEVDCIHLKNGIYHLADGTFQESRLFCRNRLPVAYNPKAAKPERWLAFLNDLLEPEDIPTLQEYLGYCLIPCTKGQKMMFLLGKGGEGKSRIGLVLKNLMGAAVSRLVLGGQDELATKEAIRMVVQRGQRTVAEAEEPGVKVPLVALDTFALQVQLGFGGDDGLDIVGLGQGVHIHVIVDHQQAAFQIGTGKAVVLHFLDAAIAGGISHEPFQHQSDAGLALAALANDEHHLLSLGAGDQAVAQIFLQGGDVGIVQQLVQKDQPAIRAGCFWVVLHR